MPSLRRRTWLSQYREAWSILAERVDVPDEENLLVCDWCRHLGGLRGTSGPTISTDQYWSQLRTHYCPLFGLCQPLGQWSMPCLNKALASQPLLAQLSLLTRPPHYCLSTLLFSQGSSLHGTPTVLSSLTLSLSLWFYKLLCIATGSESPYQLRLQLHRWTHGLLRSP